MTIIIAIIILAILVLVHELGHFLAARRIGIPVYEFSLGFGHRLYSTRKNGVEYSVRMIPLGGFVRMAGEEPGDTSHPDGFSKRKPWEKMTVAFAGPFMNFVLAVFIFVYTFAVIGVAQPVQDAIVGQILEDKPAYTAGLKTNDRILNVNGTDVDSWEHFVSTIQQSPIGTPLQLTVDRGGIIIKLAVAAVADEATGKPIIGVYPQVEFVRQGILQAIKLGFIQTYQMTMILLTGLGMLFTGGAHASDLAGPVGITSMVGEAAQGGIVYLLIFSAFLSINLGIVNLLPIPALDGSRMVFALVESVRRKPLDPEKEGFIHWMGFLFLMLIIIFATYNDIVRLIKG
ncbi:MAG: RIP metalloprotease RseP [Syntrophomonadaceae bacterium]|nr:RIP metalloprotease RseP [Syntrophomonadaceae bacterium]